MTDKPGEFGGRRANITATGCFTKTGDLENNSRRIGKTVYMGVVHDDPLIETGDRMPALATANNRIRDLFRLTRRLLAGLIGGFGRGYLLERPVPSCG